MSSLITLPGLVDMHVHLRDPGQTHKEDFYTGTAAALAGGFTMIFDMPNNAEPITSRQRLNDKIISASKQTVCDIGFYFGTLGDNFEEFAKVADVVSGLKIYLNVTTGNFIIDKSKLREIYEAWPDGKPILLHAEEDVSELVLGVLRDIPKPTHICHVSSQSELEFVLKAKEEGLPLSCGVTPHHLFLVDKDAERLGPYGFMKPFLKNQQHHDFLWSHLDGVDVIESDHAPHTQAEKDSETPPFGVPGLETTLPLLLTAEQDGRLTRQQLLERLHTNPLKILGRKADETNQVDVSMEEYEIKDEDLHTKAGWSPFSGRRVLGRVREVRLRGTTVYKEGKILTKPGSGRIL